MWLRKFYHEKKKCRARDSTEDNHRYSSGIEIIHTFLYIRIKFVRITEAHFHEILAKMGKDFIFWLIKMLELNEVMMILSI